MRLALAFVALLVGPASADVVKPQPPAKAQPKKRTKPVPPPRGDYTPTSGPAPATQHKEGEYGGVEPGQAPVATTGKHKLPPKSTLNWIGFEAKDGGATVFFQAAAPFEVAQHVEGNQLVAVLALPHLGANTWRQVDTRFFENPLSGIIAKTASARSHGSGVEVRFSFKNASDAHEASMRTATEPDGQYYVYLAFPPGTAAPAATVTKKPDAEK